MITVVIPMGNDVIKIESWWEETFWNDRYVPKMINENFTGHDRDVAYATILLVCSKYPDVGAILGVETRRICGEM